LNRHTHTRWLLVAAWPGSRAYTSLRTHSSCIYHIWLGGSSKPVIQSIALSVGKWQILTPQGAKTP